MAYQVPAAGDYVPAYEDYSPIQGGNQDIISQVLGDKIDVLTILIKDVSAEIESRKRMSLRLIEKIDEDICQAKTALYEVEKWLMGGNRHIDIRRNEIEKQIAKLIAEKRDRETERWHEISPLKKELRLLYKEYRSELRKHNIMVENRQG